MASSYSSLNFDGQMRVDANHGKNPQYAPNSFVDKFRPDAAEAPYQLADNTVSRKSHFWHEGSPTEYERPRHLYNDVMNDEARDHLHKNTVNLLAKVEYPEIQTKYLVQAYRVSAKYAKGIYDLLPQKRFSFDEVEDRSLGAEKMGKNQMFCPHAKTDKLLGKYPAVSVYN